MPKRGVTAPYHLRFQYPQQKEHGKAVFSKDEMVREVKFFLRRGASVRLFSVDAATKKKHEFHALTPDTAPAHLLVE